MELFDDNKPDDSAESSFAAPLADRMRPQNFDQFFGQEKLVGKDTPLRRAIEQDRVGSVIFWGPPGSGKTTLAELIAKATSGLFVPFSAVTAGIKEIKEVISKARNYRKMSGRKTYIFIDEIHRFNKAQQDAFLNHVESGLITLIGATTENPSFEVIAPLLSRCRVVTLNRLTEEDIAAIVAQALGDEERGLGTLGLLLDAEALALLVRVADGDARVALNSLEVAASLAPAPEDARPGSGPLITRAVMEQALQKKALVYDKSGEEHYNLISALHKSLRGSDPDAALYWLARMLEAGEDPFFIARRMVRFASEDIGNADPPALGVAMQAMEAFRFLGHPEGELALAQAAVYLATAPKSNSIYIAYGRVQEAVAEKGSLPVPLHIRNAPTKLMKGLGYGRGYRYAHDFREAYAPQDYLPDDLRGRVFYHPSDRGYEKTVSERLDRWRQLRRKAAEGGTPPDRKP